MGDYQPAIEQIDRHIRQWVEYKRVPGAALLVTDGERTLHTAAVGYANLDAREPVNPGHLFEIGSITKSFTAIALLQLVDEGKLDLHRPVADYLPWFEVRSKYEPITIHHLLTHTAGIIGVSDVLSDKLYDVWALRDTEAAWSPGSSFHYSNVGYKTLGLVLEQIEGSSYGEIIRRRILDRLGMANTEPETTLDMRSQLATGYLHYYDDRPWLPHHGVTPAAWLEIASGDGCIAAPVEDLAIYLRALMNRETRLLSAQSFDLFTSKFVEVEPDHWYGYGIDRDEVAGDTLISHGGEMPGYMCYMLANLDTQLGFIIMINGYGQTFFPSMFANQTLTAAAKGQSLPEIPALADRRLIEDAQEYAGTFVAVPDTDVVFELVAENQRLFMNYAGEKIPIWKTEDGVFVADHPDFCRLPLQFGESTASGRQLRHGNVRYQSVRNPRGGPEAGSTDERSVQPDNDLRGLTGHYRSYGSVFTNFRIVIGWDGDLLLVHQSGKEEQLHQYEQHAWRVEDTPETVRFDTFIDRQAVRAIFSGCEYYRTFTD